MKMILPMRLVGLAAAATLGLAPAAPAAAFAQPLPAEAAQTRSIMVHKDKSAAFRLSAPAGEIVVAQPDMLQIVATTDRSFYARGKAVGVTNILVYDRQRRLVEVIDAYVGYDTDAIQADLAAALPGERIAARNLAGGVLLTGDVSSSLAAAKAVAVAERYAGKAVTNGLAVRNSEQVMLEVRVIEAGRSALKELGVDLAIQNLSGFVFTAGAGPAPNNGRIQIRTNAGTTSLDVTLQALEEKGVLRTLARPNLAALSGRPASFLAGGEFPYPVPADQGQVTIAFRPFGVTLNFTPEVLEAGVIRLQVAPEVSQLDERQGIRVQGVNVPALSVRRTSTTVELRDGESFAIAGLFQQDYQNTVGQVPGLGNLPVLGALFRSASWRRAETELVIIVTPRLTNAAQSMAAAPDPLGGGVEQTLPKLILGGDPLDKPLAAPVGRQGK
jgi:pilus assembly protein CpaC